MVLGLSGLGLARALGDWPTCVHNTSHTMPSEHFVSGFKPSNRIDLLRPATCKSQVPSPSRKTVRERAEHLRQVGVSIG